MIGFFIYRSTTDKEVSVEYLKLPPIEINPIITNPEEHIQDNPTIAKK